VATTHARAVPSRPALTAYLPSAEKLIL